MVKLSPTASLSGWKGKTMLDSREKAAIVVLLFIIKILNPTKYEHQINELKTEISAQFKEVK